MECDGVDLEGRLFFVLLVDFSFFHSFFVFSLERGKGKSLGWAGLASSWDVNNAVGEL